MAFGLGLAADGGFATDTIDEIRQQAIELFTLDGMVPPMDDPVRSVLVQRMTDKIYQLQQVALDVYNKMSIGSASGAELDNLAANVGLVRKQGAAQTIDVKLTSANIGGGYVIPANTLFSTQDGQYTYQSLAATSITTTTPVTIQLQATTHGDYSVAVSDKLVSQTYIPQLTDIEITEITSAGTADETDKDLRLRFWQKMLNFIGTIQFMLSKLREIELLRKVGENHNNTSQTDADGLAPYSTEFLILPYDDVDEDAAKTAAAQEILSFMLPGLPTYGSSAVTIPDYQGKDRIVNLTVATKVPVEIFYSIAPKEDGTYSDAQAPTQKQNIVNYINNEDIAQDVSITEILGIITPDAQFDLTDYGIRRKGTQTWQKTNLSIGVREAATIDINDITVNKAE